MMANACRMLCGLAVLMLAGSCGCDSSGVPAEKMLRAAKGMSEDEVELLLGKPLFHRREVSKDPDLCNSDYDYKVGNERWTISFNGYGKVQWKTKDSPHWGKQGDYKIDSPAYQRRISD